MADKQHFRHFLWQYLINHKLQNHYKSSKLMYTSLCSTVPHPLENKKVPPFHVSWAEHFTSDGMNSLNNFQFTAVQQCNPGLVGMNHGY